MKNYVLSGLLALFFAFSPVFNLLSQETCDVGDYYNSESMIEGSIFTKAPINFAYTYSCNQIIYTTEELGSMTNGQISSLKFRCYPSENYVEEHLFSVKIYLFETDQSEYIKDGDGKFKWLPVTEDQLVFSGDFEVDFMTAVFDVEDIHLNFELSKPFKYHGKNLVLMVVKEAPECLDDTFTDFYCYPANVIDKPFRTLYACDDKSVLETPFPEKTTGALKQVPVVEFTYTENSDSYVINLLKEENISVSGHTIRVMEAGTEAVTVYSISGQQIASSVPVAGNVSMTIDGEGIYVVKMVDNNGFPVVKKILIRK